LGLAWKLVAAAEVFALAISSDYFKDIYQPRHAVPGRLWPAHPGLEGFSTPVTSSARNK
jgi:hypothetical protein